ncbi:hypothetical protein cypCar_00044623 [Cyprinus carpio]|nr:hypothetical protein cypCar_00044623 [Cyprinus carpio]
MKHRTIVTRAEHEVYMKFTLKLCPFCDFTNFISHMVQIHVRRHFEAAVKYKVGLSEQHKYSVYNSGAKRFGTESCIPESPALKAERICDTAKRKDPTSISSASSNRGSLPNMEIVNLMDDMNKPAVTAESELQCGNVKSAAMAVNPQSSNTIDTAGVCSQISAAVQPSCEKHTCHSVITSHKPFWVVEDILPNKAAWGKPLPEHLQKMVAHVLDPNRDPEEHIVSVGSTVLLRSDLLSLGLSEEVEATDVSVFVANSYVVVTWLPPHSCFPELSLPGIPKQMGGSNCGIYILMYTLYMALGLGFDFTEDDMPLIRRWWCAVLLDNFTPQICFRDVVTREVFQKAAHFAWLDSVVNWKNFSPVYRNKFRQMYIIRECLQCRALFKSYPPGEYYRLPEATTQLAKISKLLLAMEKGSLRSLQGKSLEEIDIEDDDPALESPSAVVSENPAEKKDARRKQKQQWPPTEITAVMRHFKNHITQGKLATKIDCQQCKNA